MPPEAEIRALGRVRFVQANGVAAQHQAGFDSALVILRPPAPVQEADGHHVCSTLHLPSSYSTPPPALISPLRACHNTARYRYGRLPFGMLSEDTGQASCFTRTLEGHDL